MDSAYDVIESCNFQKYYKKARSKFSQSFDEDFDNLIRVITKKIPLLKGDYLKLPGNTKRVRDLGPGSTHHIAYTRMHIRQARNTAGRVVYLVDNKRKRMFLIDVYYKSDQENPNTAVCALAHKEYDALLESESKKETGGEENSKEDSSKNEV